MRAFWEAFDVIPADQFYIALAAILLALGLAERAWRLRVPS